MRIRCFRGQRFHWHHRLRRYQRQHRNSKQASLYDSSDPPHPPGKPYVEGFGERQIPGSSAAASHIRPFCVRQRFGCIPKIASRPLADHEHHIQDEPSDLHCICRRFKRRPSAQSELQFQGELNLPWVVSLAADHAEGRVAESSGGNSEPRSKKCND